MSDPRKLAVTEFRIVFEEDVDDLVFADMATDAGLAKLQTDGLTIKEGANYRFQLCFKVNHEILEGLKFKNKTVKRGIIGSTDEIVIGSYAPSSEPHIFTFPRHGWNECPKGMLYRGKYSCTDTFVCGGTDLIPEVEHLSYSYPLTIAKNWG